MLLLPAFGRSQQNTSDKTLRKTWEEIHKRNITGRSKDYKGPEGDNYLSPTDINENDPTPIGSGSSHHTPYNGIPYSSTRQQQGRNPGNGHGGTGTLQDDPDVTPPENVHIPKVDPPDIDLPDVDPPGISAEFWKILTIILLIVALAFILYFVLKNRQPQPPSIPFEPLDEHLNPATISKTELEMRLEEAMNREDYRECVRIYFLFGMKELIQRRWIFWKKEKTNIHYIIEMQGRPTVSQFEQLVGVYELVWYGDYDIDKTTYLRMQPTLESYYKTLEQQA